MKATVRLAGVRVTLVSAEIDVEVLSTRLKVLAREPDLTWVFQEARTIERALPFCRSDYQATRTDRPVHPCLARGTS